MRGLLCRLVCLALVSLIAPAAASDGRRMLAAEEAVAWRGVGRLNIAGRRFCTASLIAPDIALTAAHCLYNPRTKQRVRLSEIRFVAGLRLGHHVAARRVRAAATMPGYAYDGEANLRTLSADVALVALEAPVAAEAARPFDVGDFDAGSPDMAVVSYARDRAHAPSIEHDCGVIRTMWPIAALDCDVTQGASGAPVFDLRAGAGGPRIVAVISALGRSDGDDVALTVVVGHVIAPLLAALGQATAALPPR